MDLSATVLTRADQLNAEDLLPKGRFGGPTTFTITRVSRGNTEQPVELHLAEYDQPYKPCKTVRRILIDMWGADGTTYVGKRLTLYTDPKVRFGPEVVGGIRVEAMSDIGDRPRQSAQKCSRGQRKTFTIKPLPSTATPAKSDAFTPEARDKWVTGVLDALTEGECADPADQIAAIEQIIGRSIAIGVREDITDTELRTVATTLAEWKKAGNIGQKLSDLLNEAALKDAANADDDAALDAARESEDS